MEQGAVVYKVIVCRNKGEEPFYIKIEESGSFSSAFGHSQFDFREDQQVSPQYSMMLPDGICVTRISEVKEPSSYILNQLKKNNNVFSVENIKKFENCAECNKTGMKLILDNGTVLSPENSDVFAYSEGKYVSINYNGQLVYAYVESYKYHTVDKHEEITLIEGCLSRKPKVTKKYVPQVGRKVDPDVLVNKCTKC